MIITGYQGIGKSTLAQKNDKVIDLESSCFCKTDKNGNTTKPDDWYVYYCQVAQHLSKQGYTVFVSCHREVRDYLSMYSQEKFCAIFPSQKLKTDWLKRLETRYNNSKLDKDLRALEHTKKYYNPDIARLEYEAKKDIGLNYYSDIRIIHDMNYNLQELVDSMNY